MEAILLIGIQASGKTTFYNERFAGTHVRISMDLLRTRNRERERLQKCVEAGKPFVVDNTNPTRAERARYIGPSRAAGYRVIGYFFEPDPKGSYARNEKRDDRTRVPPAGLFGTLKRLERPGRSEGFDELYRVRLPEPGKFAVERWAGAHRPPARAPGPDSGTEGDR